MCRYLAFLILTVAIVSPGSSAKTHLHPRLKLKQKTVRRVAFIPPTAEMRIKRLKGANVDESESATLASGIAVVVSDALRMRGWEVDDNVFSDKTLLGKENLKNLVNNLRARHETLVREMAHRSKDVNQGRYSLGPEIAALKTETTADVLVFVHGTAIRFPLGGILLSPPVLHITLIDPDNGEVLCYTMVSGARFNSALEKKIAKELREVP